ncbi:MAG: DUF370 domain-containing protein [Clostridia bacterium]|nr:DUF370 domain-containing protein [Clostridia bacterium]
MFLHVGNNKNIREKNIIGIFDMDNATVSTITRKFLSECQKKNTVESANDDIPKSFVVYKDGDNTSVCFSQLSSLSLYGRIS